MTVSSAVETRIASAPVSANLATSVDDRPHVAPVWYGYREGTLFFMTGGRKLANLRRNPRVSLSIESARGADVDWNVTLLGRATVIDDPGRIDSARDWIYDAYEDADPADDSGDELETDGGESDGSYALVEVAIGSASLNVYD